MFHNLVVAFELRFHDSPHVVMAVHWYSLISPPRTLRRWILAAARSLVAATVMASQSGGRRFLPRIAANRWLGYTGDVPWTGC